jgi:hypothetical protein
LKDLAGRDLYLILDSPLIEVCAAAFPDRIEDKHLLTLETAISIQQTDEMAAKRLTLVLPRSLHQTYTPGQQTRLMDLAGFTALVHERQKL